MQTKNNKNETKDNLQIQCKSSFIAGVKNFGYVNERLSEKKKSCKMNIAYAKEQYELAVERAKEEVEQVKREIEAKKEQLKDLDNAYKKYVENQKEAWGERYNIIVETEEEYRADMEKKVQEKISWYTEKGYTVPAYLLKELKSFKGVN
jgi:hypothetical protein